MFYLYTKTHNITGLKYLGFTSKDPYGYRGSGKYWKLHLSKHGNDVTTIVLAECDTILQIREIGLYYSELFSVVDSCEWANLKPESGDGGSLPGTNLGRKHSASTKQLISEKRKGKPNPLNSRPRTDEEKAHLREINLGKTLSAETVEKMRLRMQNFVHTETSKEKMRRPKSESARNSMKRAWELRRANTEPKVWITNGIANCLIAASEVIPDGWIKGRTTVTVLPSQKGKFWVNDGAKNCMMNTIPEGWAKGRLKRKNDVLE